MRTSSYLAASRLVDAHNLAAFGGGAFVTCGRWGLRLRWKISNAGLPNVTGKRGILHTPPFSHILALAYTLLTNSAARPTLQHGPFAIALN